MKLEIKKDKDEMIWVPGTTIKKVKSAQELIDLFDGGSQKRKRRIASTSNLDTDSLRSHLIMSIIIESVNVYNNEIIKSKISFIDLASPERYICYI